MHSRLSGGGGRPAPPPSVAVAWGIRSAEGGGRGVPVLEQLPGMKFLSTFQNPGSSSLRRLFLPGLHIPAPPPAPLLQIKPFSSRKTWKIMSRARIWPVALQTKHVVCSGFTVAQRAAPCLSPPTSGRPATGLMSRGGRSLSPACRAAASGLLSPTAPVRPPSQRAPPASLVALTFPRPTAQSHPDLWPLPSLYFQTHIHSLGREKTQIPRGG